MRSAIVVLVGLLGVPVGAFLNVVIDRVPDKAPLRGPRDGEASAPVVWAGVPAQPWVLRRGRANLELPRRWLWVEVTTAVAFALVAARYWGTGHLVPVLLLAASLVAVSVIDLQLLRIPDRVTFPTLAVAVPLIVAVSLQNDVDDSIRAALIGAAAYFLLLFVPHLVYPRGMGFGDVKLALVMGLYLGWVGWRPDLPVAGPVRTVLYGLMLGCVLGVVFGLAVRVVTRHRGEFPFGPALATACMVVVLTTGPPSV